MAKISIKVTCLHCSVVNYTVYIVVFPVKEEGMWHIFLMNFVFTDSVC
jgi:hypothetical protein